MIMFRVDENYFMYFNLQVCVGRNPTRSNHMQKNLSKKSSNKRYLFKNLMYERNLKYMACFFDRGVLRYQEQNKSNNRLHTLFIVHYLEKKEQSKTLHRN